MKTIFSIFCLMLGLGAYGQYPPPGPPYMPPNVIWAKLDIPQCEDFVPEFLFVDKDSEIVLPLTNRGGLAAKFSEKDVVLKAEFKSLESNHEWELSIVQPMMLKGKETADLKIKVFAGTLEVGSYEVTFTIDPDKHVRQTRWTPLTRTCRLTTVSIYHIN